MREYFDNGYGVSVVCNEMSYGHEQDLMELAVITYNKDEDGNVTDWDLCYDTPITADVLGCLTYRDVYRILEEVKALPKREGGRG